MQSRKEREERNRVYHSAKSLLLKYIRRYFTVLLIATPIIAVFEYVMSEEVKWWSGLLSFTSSLVMVLLAILIGVIYFTKKDDREKRESTKERERDPFAD